MLIDVDESYDYKIVWGYFANSIQLKQTFHRIDSNSADFEYKRFVLRKLNFLTHSFQANHCALCTQSHILIKIRRKPFTVAILWHNRNDLENENRWKEMRITLRSSHLHTMDVARFLQFLCSILTRCFWNWNWNSSFSCTLITVGCACICMHVCCARMFVNFNRFSRNYNLSLFFPYATVDFMCESEAPQKFMYIILLKNDQAEDKWTNNCNCIKYLEIWW